MCLKAAETKGLLQILPWALAVQQLADTAVHVQGGKNFGCRYQHCSLNLVCVLLCMVQGTKACRNVKAAG